jgi:zinc protease
MNSKKFSFRFFIILSLLSFCVATSFAQEQQKQKPPVGGTPKPFTLPKVETFTLKNGLQVRLVPYGSVPKVAVTAIIRVGGINEPEGKTWLADLTGTLLKEGTQTRNAAKVAEEAARMGTNISVLVNLDTTRIGGDVLSEFGPQLIALLADMIERPLLPATEVQRLSNDLLRQLTVSKSQPGLLASELFNKTLYPNHRYGRIFPTEAMIKSLTVEDAQKFYKENYGAARTFIYVVGQFDSEAMKRAIAQAFEGWAQGSEPYINIPKPAAVRSINLIDRPGAVQSTLYIGLPAIDPSNPDYIAFQVTNSLLGGSFSSRITSNIREQKGYTYSPSSQLSVRYRDAYWVQIADVTTAVTGPSIKEIFYEIERLRKETPTEEELQGIKNLFAGIFVLQNSSRQGIINQLSLIDLHGLPANYLSTYVQNVLAVTPKDVQRIAQQYLLPEKMIIAVVGDKAKIAEQLNEFGKVTDK